MKEVIAYATQRHIDIIPEIDMPGHMMAAIKAYPYLTCSGTTGWGKTSPSRFVLVMKPHLRLRKMFFQKLLRSFLQFIYTLVVTK